MSIIDGMMGVTLELSEDQMGEIIRDYLLPDEEVEKGYQIIRDLILFTDRRIIIINHAGFTGKKIEYQMIPYKNINRYIIETPGNMDTDYTVKLFLTGSIEPLEKQFRKTVNILELNRLLGSHIL